MFHVFPPLAGSRWSGTYSKKNGFTLMELLIVMIIIVILTAIVFANYKSGQRQLALQRAANKLGQDIRRIQSMAGLAEEGCEVAGFFPADYEYGYGIHFESIITDQYVLFADCNGNKTYDSSDDKDVEIIKFEKEVQGSGNETTIIFVPPDPIVFGSAGSELTGSEDITIYLKKDSSKQKTITVHGSGLVETD